MKAYKLINGKKHKLCYGKNSCGQFLPLKKFGKITGINGEAKLAYKCHDCMEASRERKKKRIFEYHKAVTDALHAPYDIHDVPWPGRKDVRLITGMFGCA